MQLPSAAETSHRAICNDESTSAVDVTDDRKSTTSNYACADCGDDRMCVHQCARAHRVSRDHHRLNDESSLLFCMTHPRQPIVAYCEDCEKVVCQTCRSLGPRLSCPHSTCCDLSTAAPRGRAQLQQHQQVSRIKIQYNLWIFRHFLKFNKIH